MISRWSRINNQAYWSLAVVVAGLALIGGTVYNLQHQQRSFTSAAGDSLLPADQRALSWQVRPLAGQVEVDLQLSSLDQAVSLARLSLTYDPESVEFVSAKPGHLFDQVSVNPSDGRLTLISQGRFYGQGSWARLRFRVLSSPAQLRVDPAFSILQYEGGESRQVAEITLPLE